MKLCALSMMVQLLSLDALLRGYPAGVGLIRRRLPVQAQLVYPDTPKPSYLWSSGTSGSLAASCTCVPEKQESYPTRTSRRSWTPFHSNLSPFQMRLGLVYEG